MTSKVGIEVGSVELLNLMAKGSLNDVETSADGTRKFFVNDAGTVTFWAPTVDEVPC